MRDNAMTTVGVPPVVLFLGAGLLVVLALNTSFEAMYVLWQLSAHQHGLIVLPVALWLVWRASASLSATHYAPSLTAVVALMLLLLIWLLGYLSRFQALEHLAALAAIPITFSAVAGWSVAWRLRFPLAFVLLALPISDVLVPTMVRLTADIAEFLLALVGVPFYRVGQHISLPGGNFVVADVCSGIRYFTAGMLTLLVFAHLSFRTVGKSLGLLVFGAAVLVFANGFRAFATMLIASATEMRVLGGADHIYFGWVLFGVVIFSLLWAASQFADDERIATTNATVERAAGTAGTWRLGLILAAGMLIATLNPLQSAGLQALKLTLAAALAASVFVVFRGSRSMPRLQPVAQRGMSSRSSAVVLLTVVLIATAAWGARAISGSESEVTSQPLIATPTDCTATAGWQPAWQPDVVGARVEDAVRVSCRDGTVDVFVAAFARALQGAELVSSAHRFWPRGAETAHTSPVADALPVVNEARFSDEDGAWLAWQWYDVDGQANASGWRTKRDQVAALLQGRPAGGRLIVLASSIDATGVDATRARLRRVQHEVSQ